MKRGGMKRRRSCQFDRNRNLSTFVNCPACGEKISAGVIGVHLDTDCPSSKILNSVKKKQKKIERIGGDVEGGGSRVEAAEKFGGKSERNDQHNDWRALLNGSRVSDNEIVAYGKKTINGPKIPLTEIELCEHTPCQVLRNVLDKKLANGLLEIVGGDAGKWVRGTWWMFGKKHIAPRSSTFFELNDGESEDGVLPCEEESSREVSIAVETKKAREELQAASKIINEIVNTNRKDRNPECSQEEWKCSYALANWYKDGQDCVGAHSDRLTLLGPRPTIASLSLGASRTFRIRREMSKHSKKDQKLNRITFKKPQEKGASTPSNTTNVIESSRNPKSGENKVISKNNGNLDGQFVSVDIMMPHNTLIIMWPPCQEEWRHEVPRCATINEHPISGTGRLNITFRQLKKDWADKVPKCRCGRGAIMKAKVGVRDDGKISYYYACDNTQGPACGFFKWIEIDE